MSSGKTPLWLNANKYGLSSLEENNGYLRVQAIRPLNNDSSRRWGLGYGLDVAAPVHYTSHVVVQQAFAELRWLHGTLTVGAKEWPMELKNNALSSGSQALGINARPVPQVRLALPQYWTLPFANRWLHLKGHIAYGRLTDQNWQHDFTQKQSKYADDVLLHTKAGYLMIGNPDRFCPWSLELGLLDLTIKTRKVTSSAHGWHDSTTRLTVGKSESMQTNISKTTLPCCNSTTTAMARATSGM